MIDLKHIRDFRPSVRYMDGASITLQTIQEALKDGAQRYGIPLGFEFDQVKSGGMFSKTVEDCLVLYHPERRKHYYQPVVRIQRQGNVTFVHVGLWGMSSNDQMADATSDSGFFAKAVLGPKKNKIEEEQNYYSILNAILDEVIA